MDCLALAAYAGAVRKARYRDSEEVALRRRPYHVRRLDFLALGPAPDKLGVRYAKNAMLFGPAIDSNDRTLR